MEKNKEQETRAIYYCSFCGKEQDQIQQLVAGPGGVRICNECIDFCRKTIEDEPGLSLESIRERIRGRIPVEKREHICGSCGTYCPASYHYCFNCGSALTQERRS